MVKSYTKTLSIFATITTLALSIINSGNSAVYADNTTNFNVNVRESIAVSITTPSSWASGNIDTFLRNKINVSVTSNNSAGFTATMSSKTTDTSLTNTLKRSYTLPTLDSSSTRGNFPANYWGYSLDDTESGSSSSTYNAMVSSSATPITLLSSASATSGSKDFYFGAKGDATLASGTYTGTVVINVVSGVIDNTNPVTPTNPANPGSTDNTATYSAAPIGSTSQGSTTYTYRRTNSGNNTSTVTTEVSEGNNVNSYIGYTPPQGEIYRTSSSIANNTAITTGLATAAAIATASGMFFFIVVSEREDDDEEETPQN